MDPWNRRRSQTADIAVVVRAAGDRWECHVRVAERGSTTEHRVTVTRTDLERLDPEAADPSRLVRRAFEFLLVREPKESILRSFELTEIGRYFPEWEKEIAATT